jgi:hypothetical protein
MTGTCLWATPRRLRRVLFPRPAEAKDDKQFSFGDIQGGLPEGLNLDLPHIVGLENLVEPPYRFLFLHNKYPRME